MAPLREKTIALVREVQLDASRVLTVHEFGDGVLEVRIRANVRRVFAPKLPTTSQSSRYLPENASQRYLESDALESVTCDRCTLHGLAAARHSR